MMLLWSEVVYAVDTASACQKDVKPLHRLIPLIPCTVHRTGAHCGAGRLCVGLPQARPAGALYRKRLPAVVQGESSRHPRLRWECNVS